MKKFLVLYMAPASAMEQMSKATPDEMKTVMNDWTRWGKQNQNAIADMGSPLAKTKRITSAGTTDAKNELGGYSVIEGESLESVAGMFHGHPHLKIEGASIEVVECMSMGMYG